MFHRSISLIPTKQDAWCTTENDIYNMGLWVLDVHHVVRKKHMKHRRVFNFVDIFFTGVLKMLYESFLKIFVYR